MTWILVLAYLILSITVAYIFGRVIQWGMK